MYNACQFSPFYLESWFEVICLYVLNESRLKPLPQCAVTLLVASWFVTCAAFCISLGKGLLEADQQGGRVSNISNELWYTIQSLNLLRWMICTVHVDEMFLLNDALQPFQVSKGQAGHNISWFLYANRPLLLHSRLCVCVYFCVITHAWPQQYLPSILITPFLALIGLTEFVHVSPTPVCDLIPCYTAWHIDESPCDSLIASNRREKH